MARHVPAGCVFHLSLFVRLVFFFLLVPLLSNPYMERRCTVRDDPHILSTPFTPLSTLHVLSTYTRRWASTVVAQRLLRSTNTEDTSTSTSTSKKTKTIRKRHLSRRRVAPFWAICITLGSHSLTLSVSVLATHLEELHPSALVTFFCRL